MSQSGFATLQNSNLPSDVPIQFITDSGTAIASGHTLLVNGASGASTSVGLPNQIIITGGTGDVVGPASSVNNDFASFSGTTGKLIKDSGFTSTSFFQVANNLSEGNAATMRTNLGLGSLALLNSPLDVPNGGTGAISLTGVVIGHGVGALTGNPISQFNVLSGGLSNAINSISPNTAGFVMVSNGLLAQPSFQPMPTASSITYYLQNTASGVATYFKQLVTPYSPKTDLPFAAIGSGATLLRNWITDPGIPNLLSIPAGTFIFHIHADQTAGSRNVQLYAEIWESTSLGVDIAKIGTTELTPVLGGSETEYEVAFVTANVYTMASTASRITTRVFAQGAVVGSNATIHLFIGGTADSHIELPSNTVDVSNFVPYTGAVSNLDLGLKTITASSATLTNALTGANGGTGVNNGASTITLGGSLTTSGAFASTFTMTNTTNVTFPTSGTLATTAQLPSLPLSPASGGTGVANNAASTLTISGNFATTFTVTNTTGVTLPTSGTLATTAQLPSITATQYDVLVGGAANAIVSVGPGSAGQVLQSGGNAANPAYSTPTYPSASGTAGKVLIADGTNVVYSTPTYPNASATSGKIIISDGTNFIASTPTYPNTSGTSGKVVISDGTNNVYSTPTFPNASATLNKIIKSDGTNWIASTETYAAPGTSGNVLTSDGTNWTSAAPATGITGTATQFDVIVGAAGNTVASVGPGSAGQVLQSGGNAANPAYSTATYPATATTTGQILRANGTNWVGTTATYPTTAGTSGNVLTSDGTNWTSAAAPGGGLKVATGFLTNSQIKALHATPIEVIPAPGNGKVIHILHFLGSLNYGGNNAFTAGAAQTIQVNYASNVNAGTILSNTGITRTSSQVQTQQSTISSTNYSFFNNTAVNLLNPIATEITGNAANDNTISYVIVYLIDTIP